MRLHLLDEVYPMGDEVVLIYEATGRVVRPGGLPIEQGVAVFNVETVYNVYRAVEEKQPVTDKYVSVVAEVSDPVTVRVPLGCTLEEVVGQHRGIHIGQVALAAAGELHIARRDPSLDGTRRHIVPNFLLGAAAVHFVVCDRDCNPITQSGSAEEPPGVEYTGTASKSTSVLLIVPDTAPLSISEGSTALSSTVMYPYWVDSTPGPWLYTKLVRASNWAWLILMLWLAR